MAASNTLPQLIHTDNLQLEVQDLKVQLQERAAVAAAAAAAQVPSSNGVPSKSAEEDLMGVIDGLVQVRLLPHTVCPQNL
jgi:hypothetical protein